jgi:hypothetical protein
MKLHEAFSPDESKKIYDNFLAIVNDPKRRDRLVSKYGKNAENVAYGTAVNQVKKQAANNIEEPQPEETMENNRLREMVIDALTEKKKSSAFTSEYDDKFTDKRKNLPDGLQKSILKKQGKLNEGVTDEIEDYFELMIQNQPEDALALVMDLVKNDGKNWGEWIDNIQADIVDTAGGDYEGDIRGYREELEEDLDLGHTDDEPHMIKAELYQIGTYALELYKMLNKFEGPQEVDLPAWWQSKITTAKNMVSSAKHYLDFELKEPKLDAIISAQDKENAVGEEMTPQKSKKIGMPFKAVAEEKAIDKMSKGQIKKRGEIFDTLKDKGMSDEKAGKIATSTSMKKKIKEAILAKLKNK